MKSREVIFEAGMWLIVGPAVLLNIAATGGLLVAAFFAWEVHPALTALCLWLAGILAGLLLLAFSRVPSPPKMPAAPRAPEPDPVSRERCRQLVQSGRRTTLNELWGQR